MPDVGNGRYMTRAGWDDVPHLSEEVKKQQLASMEPHLRDARTRGVPTLGVGAIYPIQPEDVWVDPFVIPEHWPKVYALDVGWNMTAALWTAWNPSDGVCYPYAEYCQGKQLPAVHAAGIRSRGEWIRGVVDPASRGRSQKDGERLFSQYKELGLSLTNANNAVDAGIQSTWMLLATGRLRPFRTLNKFWNEFRLYRREEDGKIVKEYDHLMDCLRYTVNSGRAVARTRPVSRLMDDGSNHMLGDLKMGY